ncbi:MAG: SUMF1/EgtB/PvdO family nonheme iron enzyme, partial [Spirochaetales bacterium]|nr:SUMF1/EgtB/PvdO family nonheme iron enzyme [Spirochaetales bacterium]
GVSHNAGTQMNMPGEDLLLYAQWTEETPSPSPSPSPSPTASPSPTPSPTASPSPTPSPTASPSPTPSPTASPSPSPTPVTYSVSYNGSDADSGSAPVDGTGYQAGATVTVLGNTGNLQKDGFSFEGWSVDEAAYRVDYEPNDTFVIDSANVILYAVWKPEVTEHLTGVDTVRERGHVSIGNVEVGLIYAKNTSPITFPVTIYNNVSRTLETPFLIGETEVTNAALAKVLQWGYDHGRFSTTLSDPNGLNQNMIKYGGRELFDMNDTGNLCRINFSNGRFTVEAGSEERPALRMSLYGAVIFCNWLTEMRDGNDDEVVYSGITAESWSFTEHPERSGYRLPTSIEWQYCARYLGTTPPATGDLATERITRNENGGSSTLTSGYYWTPGDYLSGATADYENPTASGAVAVYQDNSSGPASVATKAPNFLGLYDMSGNADEWCIDGEFSASEYLGGGNYGNPLSSGYLCIDDPKSVRLGSTMNPSYGFRITRTLE